MQQHPELSIPPPEPVFNFLVASEDDPAPAGEEEAWTGSRPQDVLQKGKVAVSCDVRGPNQVPLVTPEEQSSLKQMLRSGSRIIKLFNLLSKAKGAGANSGGSAASVAAIMQPDLWRDGHPVLDDSIREAVRGTDPFKEVPLVHVIPEVETQLGELLDRRPYKRSRREKKAKKLAKPAEEIESAEVGSVEAGMEADASSGGEDSEDEEVPMNGAGQKKKEQVVTVASHVVQVSNGAAPGVVAVTAAQPGAPAVGVPIPGQPSSTAVASSGAHTNRGFPAATLPPAAAAAPGSFTAATATAAAPLSAQPGMAGGAGLVIPTAQYVPQAAVSAQGQPNGARGALPHQGVAAPVQAAVAVAPAAPAPAAPVTAASGAPATATAAPAPSLKSPVAASATPGSRPAKAQGPGKPQAPQSAQELLQRRILELRDTGTTSAGEVIGSALLAYLCYPQATLPEGTLGSRAQELLRKHCLERLLHAVSLVSGEVRSVPKRSEAAQVGGWRDAALQSLSVVGMDMDRLLEGDVADIRQRMKAATPSSGSSGAGAGAVGAKESMTSMLQLQLVAWECKCLRASLRHLTATPKTLFIKDDTCRLHGVPSNRLEQPGRMDEATKALKMVSLLYPSNVTFMKEVGAEWIDLVAPEIILRLCHSKSYMGRIRGRIDRATSDMECLTADDISDDDMGESSSQTPGRDTIGNKYSWLAASTAVAAVLQSIDYVMRGSAYNAFCAVRPPGHHAGIHLHCMGAVSNGFCLVNNVALGALYAHHHLGVQRVAVLDFDVHHGNGTQEVLCRNYSPHFLYASIHAFGTDEQGLKIFPGTGDPASQKDHKHVMNMAVGKQVTPPAFHKATLMAINRLKQFKPDLLLLSAGFDAHMADPSQLGTLTCRDFEIFTRRLVIAADEICAGRVVSVLEGGYALDCVASGGGAGGMSTRRGGYSYFTEPVLVQRRKGDPTDPANETLADCIKCHVTALVEGVNGGVDDGDEEEAADDDDAGL
ncbi:unnamed protein product [Chrysoparadoxa australica]